MKTTKSIYLALLAVLLSPMAANADAITVDFPSADSTVVASSGQLSADEFGYFWSVSRGDSITESFATSLASISELTLAFDVTQNVLNNGASTMWDVLINGILVGGWSWSDSDGTGSVNETYSFASIFGGGGIYEISMEVTNEVPGGRGSIAIGFPGTATLAATSVPEPGTLALLGLGLVGMAARRRKKV